MTEISKQFIFLGPPGSGKGTQAKIIAGRLNLPHISTGDIFRDQIARGTDLGKAAAAVLTAGQLMSDDITNNLVKDRLLQTDCVSGFILDGYPRSLPQAEFLFKLAPQALAIYIKLSDVEVIKRLAGRRMSKSTGAIYHLEFNPPPANWPVDDLIARSDETSLVLQNRLRVYHNDTEPLLNFYNKYGLLKEVDGSPAIAVVTQLIIKLLSSS